MEDIYLGIEKKKAIKFCESVVNKLRETSDLLLDHQIAMEEELDRQISILSSRTEEHCKKMLETATRTRNVVHEYGWGDIHLLGEQIRFIDDQKKNIREAEDSTRILLIIKSITCVLNKRYNPKEN